jgi:hypothetical protein
LHPGILNACLEGYVFVGRFESMQDNVRLSGGKMEEWEIFVEMNWNVSKKRQLVEFFRRLLD